MPSVFQIKTGTGLIRSGLLLELGSIVWGGFIPLTPFPRLALVGHLVGSSIGILALSTGILLRSDFFDLSRLQLKIVGWGISSSWLMVGVEMANAWWGARKALPIAAAHAGITDSMASGWAELLVTYGHIVPSVAQIIAFTVLAVASCTQNNIKQK